MSAAMALALASLLVVPLARRAEAFPAEPGLTFAAHEEHGVLVIDRMDGGRPAVLAGVGDGPRPTYLLHEGGARTFVVRIERPGEAVVRRPGGPPGVARAELRTDGGMVRLVLRPGGGERLRCDPFVRRASRAHPSAVEDTGREGALVAGTYEAPLRDASGARVGWVWFRRRRQAPDLTFQASLPRTVDEGLAAAAATALGSAIDGDPAVPR
ncbi:MAG TPA: hypothetical protein VKW76_05015 [Candidatus Binatia bacterium]|nr:hypothetical protein [Candidatus Binatia bacterium]